MFVGGKACASPTPAPRPGTGRFWPGTRAWLHWNPGFQEPFSGTNVGGSWAPPSLRPSPSLIPPCTTAETEAQQRSHLPTF